MADLMARLGVRDFAELHAWSLAHPAEFWSLAWDDLGIVGEKGDRLRVGDGLPGTRFFPDARLNVVDTLLAGAGEDVALVGITEDGRRRELTYAQVRADAAAVASALRATGVEPGDRVAAWMPNTIETVVFALGALSIGAVVSTASPDFGPEAIADRFGQVAPVVLLVAARYVYGGREVDTRPRLPALLDGLPSVRRVVILDGGGEDDLTPWATWLERHRDTPQPPVPFAFDQPGFILFSSGTTGRPKGIVHAAAGVLLKDLSEQAYHLDIRPGDRVAYATTCGWMMWNWLLCALGRRATVVLVDGSPVVPATDRLLTIAAQERLTFLGVSARLIDEWRGAGVQPPESLTDLRTLASTGSPLAPEAFDWVESALPRVHLASMSGGTDLCGCFVLGVPTEPVIRGEIQGPALGLDVTVFTDAGTPAPVGETGELVCRSPFPSVPLRFWDDPDGARFRASYFERFPGVWAHGDFAVRTPSGGFVILGRSDATLNAKGVRIGTAEIYRVVEGFDEVAGCLAVGQSWEGDSRIVLFVELAPGRVLDADLEAAMRRVLREKASPRHVPAIIAAAPALPRTHNGKLAELAVSDTVNGRTVRDTSALANADCLAWFAGWTREQTAGPAGG